MNEDSPSPESIRGMKRALRARWLVEREALPPEIVATASAAAREHLEAWLPFAQAHTVLMYMAFRNEIDLTPLLTRHPTKRWVLPRIAPSRALSLHLYRPGALARHPYGMLEPTPDCPEVAPEAIELALIPGVAFDRRGFRLGYGGGYFDRLLPRLRGITVGVTYARFVVEELPHTAQDSRVQWILTEAGWLRAED